MKNSFQLSLNQTIKNINEIHRQLSMVLGKSYISKMVYELINKKNKIFFSQKIFHQLNLL